MRKHLEDKRGKGALSSDEERAATLLDRHEELFPFKK
jgi:hypothetical protein